MGSRHPCALGQEGCVWSLDRTRQAVGSCRLVLGANGLKGGWRAPLLAPPPSLSRNCPPSPLKLRHHVIVLTDVMLNFSISSRFLPSPPTSLAATLLHPHPMTATQPKTATLDATTSLPTTSLVPPPPPLPTWQHQPR